MKRLLLALLILIAPALGLAQELVARQGEDSLHLLQGTCADKAVLEAWGEEAADEYPSAAYAIVDGKRFAACWRLDRATNSVMVIYEDGDKGQALVRHFRPEGV